MPLYDLWKDEIVPAWIAGGRGLHSRRFYETMPDVGQPTRLLVQARQTWVMGVASQHGIEGAREAFEAGLGLLDRWPLDGVTAYVKAFCLLVRVKAYELTGQMSDARAVQPLIRELHSRRQHLTQNELLHTVEAVLAWSRLSPVQPILIDLLDVLQSKFFREGAIFEDEAHTIIEPGHQFEWIWLLCDLEDLLGHKTMAIRNALYITACEGITGLDGGMYVINSLDRDRRPLDRAFRLWPQLEAYKAHLIQTGNGPRSRLTSASLRRSFHRPGGLWQERLDAGGAPTEQAYSPASSLYHITTAAMVEKQICASSSQET